uniref:Uncharacterized protein n=1 Tax=Lactuca sativa TaxID=4236 RepID=A0A9R1UGC3_LACSA|nr:hypothetical protein LSAT_V11C900470520 [Lactuca sativa]
MGPSLWFSLGTNFIYIFLKPSVFSCSITPVLTGFWFSRRFFPVWFTSGFKALKNRYQSRFLVKSVQPAGPVPFSKQCSRQKYPWEGTDQDYLYELLSRVFHILRENNSELARDRRRIVIRHPQVLREGTEKTVSVNFMDLCRTYACLHF